jgi:hypothetical protein
MDEIKQQLRILQNVIQGAGWGKIEDKMRWCDYQCNRILKMMDDYEEDNKWDGYRSD